MCSLRAVRGALDDLARGAHLRRAPRRESAARRALDGDRPDVLEREVVAGQRQRVRRSRRRSRSSGEYSALVSDPVFDVPRELRAGAAAARASALDLLRRPDFRRLYLAVCASELGDSLHYIALMWFALDAGGPLGVVAVRLADSVPAFVFGLARRPRRRPLRAGKRLMVGADLVRAVVLVPVAIAGLAGAPAALGRSSSPRSCSRRRRATSRPRTARLIPALVDRANVQRANALVQATAQALSIGGWALAAALARVHAGQRRSSPSTRRRSSSRRR